MIVFNGLELIGLTIMAVLLVICGFILVIDRIAYAMRIKRMASDGNIYQGYGDAEELYGLSHEL